MENLVIKDSTYTEVSEAENFLALVDEYVVEATIQDLPHAYVNFEGYKQLEKAGLLHVKAAYLSDKLIGFIFLINKALNHHGIQITISESIFVAKEYRKTGAGIKLIKAAEDYAKTNGSLGVVIGAPFGSALQEVLPHIGYKEANRLFFRKIAHE